jgi:hypothetical protein
VFPLPKHRSPQDKNKELYRYDTKITGKKTLGVDFE